MFSAMTPYSPLSTPKIRTVVLGVGHAHAAAKIRLLRELPEFDLVGVCEPEEALQHRYGGDESYKGVRWVPVTEVLADPSIELIVVESRVQDNLGYAQQAIEAGKHVHLDKPPGNNLEKLRSLLDEADRRHLAVQMGYMWRYHPGIQIAIEAARKGWLGNVYLFRGVVCSDIAAESRVALASFQGGMMFELGCHLIDRMVDLLGRPGKVTPFLRHDGSDRDNLEDSTLAVFEYDKAMAEIYSTAQQPSGGSHRLVQIQGTNGTVTLQPIEPPSINIDLKAAAGPYRSGLQTIRTQSRPRYVGDFQEMAQVIRNQQSPSFSSKHDLNVQDTLLRACGVL